MDDLTITRLCAEAMGGRVEKRRGVNYLMLYDEIHSRYDPLHDDAQAMALVKKFHLSILFAGGDDWQVGHFMPDDGNAETVFEVDLNRAICECVANMQKAKP